MIRVLRVLGAERGDRGFVLPALAGLRLQEDAAAREPDPAECVQSSDQRSTSSVTRREDEQVLHPSELVRVGGRLWLLVDRGVEDRTALRVRLVGEDEADRDEAGLPVGADRGEDGAPRAGHEGALGAGQDGLAHGVQTTLAA